MCYSAIIKQNNFCISIKKIESKFRSNLYKANIVSVDKHFLEKSFKLGWNGLKKLAKPRYGHDTYSSQFILTNLQLLNQQKQTLQHFFLFYNYQLF